uniref:ADAMTS like 1 n=1 Tax=Lepisosteus oculatus TaxID=7918 RepID=W5N0T6_LEPOC
MATFIFEALGFFCTSLLLCKVWAVGGEGAVFLREFTLIRRDNLQEESLSESLANHKSDDPSSRTARSEEDRDTLWDAWGPWSDCSRTCAGGASYSLRRCLSSKSCEGQNIRYRTCSNVECPPEAGDFRAQQCSAHVDVRYQGQYYEWLPVYNDPENPCALKCKAKGTSLVVELAPKVLDGTRCYTESLDMCISGTCQIVGCDHELGSTAKEDNCGVCNGDGSSCRLVRGHYKSQLSTSKTEDTVIVIPYGSRHVRLVLKGTDHLYLETKTLQGLKGDNNLSTSGPYHIENTTVDFQKFPDKEILRMAGPLRADFTVKISYVSASDSVVQFIFYQPIIHRWRETDFFPCSVTCGGGYQLTSAECFDLRSGRVVVDQYCHYYPENVKPKPKLRECNMDPCPASDGYKQIMPYDLYHPLPRWESSPWTACSMSCGGGIQSRSVSCVEEDIQGTVTTADEWKCLYSPRMPIIQPCNIFDCPKWLAQEWSPCTVTCGQGLRYRVVLCIDHRGLHAGGCNPKTKPHIKEECIVPVPCYKPKEKLPVEAKLPWFKQAQELEEEKAVTEDPTFIPEAWSPCSRTCGAGTQRRAVRCQVLLSFSQTVADLPDDECDGPKPPETQPCYRRPCGNDEEEEEGAFHLVEQEELHDWEYEGFTECSESCGGGLQEAVVICLNKQTREVTQENMCVSHRRPPQLLKTCKTEPCPPRWETGAWSSCSASCGVGLRTRGVACKHLLSRENNETVVVSDDKCRLLKPTPVQACNRFDCPPSWETQDWEQCSRSCGGGVQKRVVLCKQRLADGSVLELPDTFCPSPSPPAQQACERSECPAKWASIEWSQCSATCGEASQTLVVVCRKLNENGEYVILNSSACSSLPQPLTLRSCSLGPCGRSAKPAGTKLSPHILAQRKVYVQWRTEKKLQFVVGGYAYLKPKTSVIIRCPVRRFHRGLLRWQKDGKPLAGLSHITVTPFGYLKIQHLKTSDAGTYTCVAGQAQESFVVKIIGSKHKLTAPESNLWLTATGKTLREHFLLQDKVQDPRVKLSLYDDIVLRLLELKAPSKENQYSGELLNSSEKNVSFLEEDHSLETSVPLTLVTEQWKLDEIIRNLSFQPEELRSSFGDKLIMQLLGELTKNKGESNESTLQHPERGELTSLESTTHKLNPAFHKVSVNTDILRSRGSTGTPKEQPRAPWIMQKALQKNPASSSEVIVHIGLPVLLHRWTNKLELRCEAAGSPEPAVSWSKNGVELHYSSRVEKMPDGTLKILAPSEADAGLYTCTARNSIGSASLSSDVQLAEKQTPFQIPLSFYIDCGECRNFTIIVTALCYAVIALYHQSILCEVRIWVYCKSSGREPRLTDLAHHKESRRGSELSLRKWVSRIEASKDIILVSHLWLYCTNFNALTNAPSDCVSVYNLECIYNISMLKHLKYLIKNYVRGKTIKHLNCENIKIVKYFIFHFERQKFRFIFKTKDYQAGIKSRGLCSNEPSGGFTVPWSSLCSSSFLVSDLEINAVRSIAVIGFNMVYFTDPVVLVTSSTFVCLLCGRWLVSPWSLCSRSCGGGLQNRTVSCHREPADGISTPLADSSCSEAGQRPPDSQSCNTLLCVGWATSSWTQCQGQCVGLRLATQHRHVFCQDKNGTGLPLNDCDGLQRPAASRHCPLEACAVQWRARSWTQCTATCGSHGFQSRHVTCVHLRSSKPARELQCSWRPRPASWQRCNILPCAKTECRDSTRYCEKVKQLSLCQLAQFKTRCCEACRDT